MVTENSEGRTLETKRRIPYLGFLRSCKTGSHCAYGLKEGCVKTKALYFEIFSWWLEREIVLQTTRSQKEIQGHIFLAKCHKLKGNRQVSMQMAGDKIHLWKLYILVKQCSIFIYVYIHIYIIYYNLFNLYPSCGPLLKSPPHPNLSPFSLPMPLP